MCGTLELKFSGRMLCGHVNKLHAPSFACPSVTVVECTHVIVTHQLFHALGSLVPQFYLILVVFISLLAQPPEPT